MAQQRSIPPKLSLPPPHPFQRQQSYSKSYRQYPTFGLIPTPTSNAFMFSPSLTPTPSKRPRAPEGPLWILTLIYLTTIYALYRWQSLLPEPPSFTVFTFFSLAFASGFLNIMYRPWKGRTILTSQWILIFGHGVILVVSWLLRFGGLQSCGPLETIFADFTGSLVAKVLLDSPVRGSRSVRKAAGITAVATGVLLLAYGWARADCSPIAIDISHRTSLMIINQPKNCAKVFTMLAPLLAGFLSAFQKSMVANSSLRSLGKKRVQVISYAVAAIILLPFTLLHLLLSVHQSQWQFSGSFWTLTALISFGMIVAFFGEFYSEEKLLLSVHSLKTFQIVTCCICGLELLFGLGISLVGFLFCSLVLGIGVRELGIFQGPLSWEDLDDSAGAISAIKKPVQHILSDKKSRKIAIFLLINTAFMFVEFFYGFLSNSLGLISDACHMLFDCAALAIGLYASYISRLPENSKFNYGYGRFEVVSGYANAVFLVLVATLIVLESIERILEPPEISTESLLVVSVGGLLVNVIGLIFFHEEHHHAHHGSGGHSCSHSHSHQVNKKSDYSAINCDDSSHCHSSHGQLHACNSSHVHGTLENHQSSQNHDHNHDHLHSQDHEHTHGNDHDDCHNNHNLSHDHNHNHSPIQNHNHSHDHDHSHSHAHDHCQSHDHNHNHSPIQNHNHSHDHDLNSHDHSNKDMHGQCRNHNHNHGNDHCLDLCNDSHHDDQGHEHHQHHGHDHDHQDDHNHGHEDHHHHMDHNMYGIFLHVLADTLGSVGVVISTLLIKYKGWLITDPACSIFLSALIIASVIPLLRNSAEVLLQRVPRHNEQSLQKTLSKISSMPGVKNIGRTHIWSFTNTDIVGSFHIQIMEGSDKKSIKDSASKLLHGAGIGNVTLQIEEIRTSD